jgi:hypothetical protein
MFVLFFSRSSNSTLYDYKYIVGAVGLIHPVYFLKLMISVYRLVRNLLI